MGGVPLDFHEGYISGGELLQVSLSSWFFIVRNLSLSPERKNNPTTSIKRRLSVKQSTSMGLGRPISWSAQENRYPKTNSMLTFIKFILTHHCHFIRLSGNKNKVRMYLSDSHDAVPVKVNTGPSYTENKMNANIWFDFWATVDKQNPDKILHQFIFANNFQKVAFWWGFYTSRVVSWPDIFHHQHYSFTLDDSYGTGNFETRITYSHGLFLSVGYMDLFLL